MNYIMALTFILENKKSKLFQTHKTLNFLEKFPSNCFCELFSKKFV